MSKYLKFLKNITFWILFKIKTKFFFDRENKTSGGFRKKSLKNYNLFLGFQ